MITWLTPAGSLGVITERVLQDIPLEAISNHGPVTFKVISGSLPRGLRLSTTVIHDSTPYVVNISGSPTEGFWRIKITESEIYFGTNADSFGSFVFTFAITHTVGTGPSAVTYTPIITTNAERV
jgi:hypothetical protein